MISDKLLYLRIGNRSFDRRGSAASDQHPANNQRKARGMEQVQLLAQQPDSEERAESRDQKHVEARRGRPRSSTPRL